MKEFLFELCAETLEAAKAAERGGADRIELCSRLDVGGVTPDGGLLATVMEALAIPVHVLIRPRAGDFVYSTNEMARMYEDIARAKDMGAAAVVLGVLHTDARVDVERSGELVDFARPMQVTFHRAFDETPQLEEALEAVIATGADCLLTSGGAPDVMTGAEQLARLVKQAGERIAILAGGGMRLATLDKLIEQTGVRRVHGSLRRSGGETTTTTIEEDTRSVMQTLRQHWGQ